MKAQSLIIANCFEILDFFFIWIIFFCESFDRLMRSNEHVIGEFLFEFFNWAKDLDYAVNLRLI